MRKYNRRLKLFVQTHLPENVVHFDFLGKTSNIFLGSHRQAHYVFTNNRGNCSKICYLRRGVQHGIARSKRTHTRIRIFVATSDYVFD